jgi:enediyne polyketide synthase
MPAADSGFAALADVGFDRSQYQIDGGVGARGERIMIVRWPLSFRDNRSIGGGIYFSNYFSWMGKIRELAVSPILKQLAEDMSGGQWGMVTNNARVNVLGDIAGTGVIEARYWMEGVGGRDNSTMELRFQWCEVKADGSTEPVAEGQMQITWVRVLGHGQVEVAPLPEYVQAYVDAVGPQHEDSAEEAAEPAETLGLGVELHRTSLGPRTGRILREQDFQTSLEDANLVGNIYFDNYAKWQGRVRDLFFFQAAPHLYRGGAASGELMCRQLKVQHIREAMPFDRIHVSMGLRAVYENGVKLEFEYRRVNPDGSSEKLAFAEQDAVWVVRDADGRPSAAPLPDELIRLLCDQPMAITGVTEKSWVSDDLSVVSA